MATLYKIHPAIGIARVGNSSEFYLAPETPGGLPLNPTTEAPIYTGPGVPPQRIFHDASGALKKQAARFKVYTYDNTNPTDPGTLVEIGKTQVGGKTVAGIEWTVYLANKKSAWFEFQQLTGSGMEGDAGYEQNNASGANRNPLRSNAKLGLSSDPATIENAGRRQLLLDPGPRTASGANAQPQNFDIAPKGLKPFDITTLGRISTDADSNLIVLGGEGNSGTTDLPVEIVHYANNPGWFDDLSDGPVNASLVLSGGDRVAVDVPSWVICGLPGYAPEIFNIVTLYDNIYDIYVREFGLNPALFANDQFQTGYRPSLQSEIQPILIRPNLYRFVAKTDSGAGPHEALPTKTPEQFAGIVGVLRRPADKNTPGLMPKLLGDDPISDVSRFLTLTATQFFVLNQYAEGAFSSASTATGDGIALDRAALDNCVGGAFCPGIEVTWISRNTTIYAPLPSNPSLSDAFRFRHKDVTGGLTLTNGANNDYSGGLEPGDLTKYMAQPWQADFNLCAFEQGAWWWPAQRPYTVVPAANPATQLQWSRASDTGPPRISDLQMVTNWKNLGFILNVGPGGSPSLVEIERNQKAIDDFSTSGPLVAEGGASETGSV